VLTGRRLADLELLRNEHAAHAILHEVAVNLWREVRAWLLQPVENVESTCVGKRLEGSRVGRRPRPSMRLPRPKRAPRQDAGQRIERALLRPVLLSAAARSARARFDARAVERKPRSSHACGSTRGGHSLRHTANRHHKPART
jgi:hypothetical protein